MRNQSKVHPLIQRFLQDLSGELVSIPEEEREQHVLEIEGHLLSMLQKKKEQGKDDDKAINETLVEFLPPKELAEKIISEDVDVKSSLQTEDKTNTKARISSMLGISSIILMVIIPFLGVLLGIAAFILGVLGFIEIKRTKEQGRKFAITGIVCGIVVLMAPPILAFIAYAIYMS
ncbi:DUF4190 domain-containing protein [Metallumcola ferriviriculae]|uniref:DUF4190 domain-containing protein n=1 Tax=Metallumcola ferriviriculae TaxID=3039180 RepID=A0AAU0UT62_9FIRM|nr:DUF4190 domain-containing protein [Desulfitibacteraceae bacterium MK1]